MKSIITISREFGSGGREIGKTLAEDLKIPFTKNYLKSPQRKAEFAKSFLKALTKATATAFFIPLLWEIFLLVQTAESVPRCRLTTKFFLHNLIQ